VDVQIEVVTIILIFRPGWRRRGVGELLNKIY